MMPRRASWNQILSMKCSLPVGTVETVQCQEEYASVYKSKVRPKKITFKVIDVAAWADREITVDMLESCQWQHAVDVLDAKW